MYGRLYNVIVGVVAITAEQDLFELVMPSTAAGVLRSLEVAQTTEIADAQDEMLRLRIMSGFTTSGSGGSSATPIPKALGMSASGITAEINNTTVATSGTIVTHRDVSWNVRAGYIWMPPEEEMIVIAPSARLCVRISAPADSVTFSATATVEEIG